VATGPRRCVRRLVRHPRSSRTTTPWPASARARPPRTAGRPPR
jgi:hypothetical protein